MAQRRLNPHRHRCFTTTKAPCDAGKQLSFTQFTHVTVGGFVTQAGHWENFFHGSGADRTQVQLHHSLPSSLRDKSLAHLLHQAPHAPRHTPYVTPCHNEQASQQSKQVRRQRQHSQHHQHHESPQSPQHLTTRQEGKSSPDIADHGIALDLSPANFPSIRSIPIRALLRGQKPQGPPEPPAVTDHKA